MMERELLEFLTGGGAVVDGLELRPLSAYALLQARAEALRMTGEDTDTAGLYANACILARAAWRDGAPAFCDAQAVLRQCPAEEMERLMGVYAQACAPGRLDAEKQTRLRAALQDDVQAQLRWRVLRAFGVLPTEARAREMTPEDYLYCAMQLALEEEQRLAGLCPACREAARLARCSCCGALLPVENAAFDEKRFEELKHGGVSETGDAAADGAGGGSAP